MELKAGDIIGFSGSGPISDLINVGTFGIPRWHLCHVGILAELDNQLLLFESTSLGKDVPCVLQEKVVKGVQAHTIEEFLEREGRIWVYPLHRTLYLRESRRLTYSLLGKLGKRYDLLGAGRAGGGLVLRWLRVLLRRENLDQEFCSELTADEYSKLGVLPTGNASAYNPNSFVRRARRAGVLKPRVRLK